MNWRSPESVGGLDRRISETGSIELPTSEPKHKLTIRFLTCDCTSLTLSHSPPPRPFSPIAAMMYDTS